MSILIKYTTCVCKPFLSGEWMFETIGNSMIDWGVGKEFEAVGLTDRRRVKDISSQLHDKVVECIVEMHGWNACCLPLLNVYIFKPMDKNDRVNFLKKNYFSGLV